MEPPVMANVTGVYLQSSLKFRLIKLLHQIYPTFPREM